MYQWPSIYRLYQILFFKSYFNLLLAESVREEWRHLSKADRCSYSWCGLSFLPTLECLFYNETGSERNLVYKYHRFPKFTHCFYFKINMQLSPLAGLPCYFCSLKIFLLKGCITYVLIFWPTKISVLFLFFYLLISQ